MKYRDLRIGWPTAAVLTWFLLFVYVLSPAVVGFTSVKWPEVIGIVGLSVIAWLYSPFKYAALFGLATGALKVAFRISALEETGISEYPEAFMFLVVALYGFMFWLLSSKTETPIIGLFITVIPVHIISDLGIWVLLPNIPAAGNEFVGAVIEMMGFYIHGTGFVVGAVLAGFVKIATRDS